MNISQNEYASMVNNASPKSKLLKDCIGAFSVGGFICLVGQALSDTYQFALGMDIKDARCLTSITLVFLSALFTALSWYDNIAKFAGAGTLVPITGFANAVVSPAIEFKSEGYIGGLGAKMFIIAGPVIVYGTVSSILYGLVLCIIKFF
ncbi:MAG: stage V sporulation protein AC [Clostridia bacterium]|nr:stage V sporulation protein AC [Clostridia bacterium]